MAKKIVIPPVGPAINAGDTKPKGDDLTSGVKFDDGIKNLGKISSGGPEKSSESEEEKVPVEHNPMLSKHEPKSSQLVWVIVNEDYKGSLIPGQKYEMSQEAADALVERGAVTITE